MQIKCKCKLVKVSVLLSLFCCTYYPACVTYSIIFENYWAHVTSFKQTSLSTMSYFHLVWSTIAFSLCIDCINYDDNVFVFDGACDSLLFINIIPTLKQKRKLKKKLMEKKQQQQEEEGHNGVCRRDRTKRKNIVLQRVRFMFN